MALKFTNNASTTLAAGITATDTSITVATGKGALFAALAAGDTQVLTLTDSARTVFEVVLATARTADTITITRAQEGTTALVWASGSTVFSGVTAGVLSGLATAGAGSGSSVPTLESLTSYASNGLMGGDAGGLSFAPRSHVNGSTITNVDSFGKELVFKFASCELANPPSYVNGTTYTKGTIVKGSDGVQYLAVDNVGGNVASCQSNNNPGSNDDVTLFQTGVDPTTILSWYYGYSNGLSIYLPFTSAFYFVPTEVGLIVKTDGSMSDTAHISFGIDMTTPFAFLPSTQIDIAPVNTPQYFRFPVSTNVGTSSYVSFYINNKASNAGIKATPYVKGFVIFAD